MKSIIIPTDFSENSIHAIDFAVHKLGDENCNFTILHVFQIPQGGQSGLFYLLEEMQKQAEKDMKELMSKLERRYSDKKPKFNSKILQGDLSDQVNGVANDLGADCIVMGTKGASGLKEVLIGSNTVKLMNSLSKPLYAVPEVHQYRSIKELIVAYDGKPMSSEVAEAVKYYAKRHHISLELVHIRIGDENPLQNWKEIEAMFNDVQFEKLELHADSFEHGLQAATERKEALLVMVRHKQSFWERLFNLSDSRKALMHSKLPVLVIPEN